MAIGRSTPIYAGRSPPNASWDIYYGIYLAAILDSCYLWIIRVVNSQLALYSHVRCNPLNTPQMAIRNFNYEGSYLPGLICNIVVKADLGRSPGRSTPQKNCRLVVIYGNFTFLATMKAHIGRSTGRPPPRKLPASTMKVHIGRSTGRSTPPQKTAS